jgi:hypothetical protein
MLAVFMIFIAGGAGVTIGAHRYFAHRSFKAKFGLRCLLAALFILAGEVSALAMSSLQTCLRNILLLTTKFSFLHPAVLNIIQVVKLYFTFLRPTTQILRSQIFGFKKITSCSTYIAHLQVVHVENIN